LDQSATSKTLYHSTQQPRKKTQIKHHAVSTTTTKTAVPWLRHRSPPPIALTGEANVADDDQALPHGSIRGAATSTTPSPLGQHDFCGLQHQDLNADTTTTTTTTIIITIPQPYRHQSRDVT
jgi:hypothetical protein